MKRVRVHIRGLVQGVGFRYWTKEQATALGLDGWVRNRRDRSVEAVFQGDDSAVDAMIATCRRGPRFSNVSGVEVQNEVESVGIGFEIRPTK